MMNSHGLLGPPCSCLVAGLFKYTQPLPQAHSQRHSGRTQGQVLQEVGYLPPGAHQQVHYKGHMQARWIAEGVSGSSRPHPSSGSARSAPASREDRRSSRIARFPAPSPPSSSPTVPPAPAGSAISISRPRRATRLRSSVIHIKDRPNDRSKGHVANKMQMKLEQRGAGWEQARRRPTRATTPATSGTSSRSQSQVPKRQPTHQSSVTFTKLRAMQRPLKPKPQEARPARPHSRLRLRPPLRRTDTQQGHLHVTSHKVPPSKPTRQVKTQSVSTTQRTSRTGSSIAPAPQTSSKAHLKSKTGIKITVTEAGSANSKIQPWSRMRMKPRGSNMESVHGRLKPHIRSHRASASKSETVTNKVRKSSNSTVAKAKSAFHMNSRTSTKSAGCIAAETKQQSSASRLKSFASHSSMKSMKPLRPKSRQPSTTKSLKSASKSSIKSKPSALRRSRTRKPQGRISDSSFSMYAPSCSRAKLSTVSLTTQQGSRPRIIPSRKQRRKSSAARPVGAHPMQSAHGRPLWRRSPVNQEPEARTCRASDRRRVPGRGARKLHRPSAATVQPTDKGRGRKAVRSFGDRARLRRERGVGSRGAAARVSGSGVRPTQGRASASAALVQLEVARDLLRPESIRNMSDRCLAKKPPAVNKRSGAGLAAAHHPVPNPSANSAAHPSPSHMASLFTAKWYGSAHPKRRQGLPTPGQSDQHAASASSPVGSPSEHPQIHLPTAPKPVKPRLAVGQAKKPPP